MRTKKRLLIDSWLSALLCLVMIVGVTYAWFTAGNFVDTDPIEAGYLKVGVVNANGKSMEKKTLQWMTQKTNRWEPGCTYYTEPFTIDNTGDVYFKYQLSVGEFSKDKDEADLSDVLEFHIYKYDTENKQVKTDKVYEGVEIEHRNLDKGETYVLAGTMSTKADNKYQGMKLSKATVVISATQLAGDSYDKVVVDNSGEVDFSQATQVSTYEELATAVAAASEDKPALIVLKENIEVSNTLTINGPTYIYSFEDHVLTLSAKKNLFNIKDTGSLSMEGVQLTANVDTTSIFIMAYGHLKLNDCAIKGVHTTVPLIQAYKEADVILTNTVIEENECQAVIFDQKGTKDPSINRVGTTTTRLQYCNINNNTISARGFQIYTNYFISGGTISGNTTRDGIFQVQGAENSLATLDLRYVTLKENSTTSAQVAIAWVRDYAKMTIHEGTWIEGNTASLSYGNIKVATKGILNINGGTIKPIKPEGNGQFIKVNDVPQETDNYTGIVNDQGKATITIAKEAIVEGANSGLDGYTSGSDWSSK